VNKMQKAVLAAETILNSSNITFQNWNINRVNAQKMLIFETARTMSDSEDWQKTINMQS
jgi:hypothetical protein